MKIQNNDSIKDKVKDVDVSVIVGVADMKVSNDPVSIFSTCSLGSCIGIATHDKVARVGGLLHLMLPDSSVDPTRAEKNPYMFADTGVPRLLESTYELGAKKHRMKVIVAGGAQVFDQTGLLSIGKRNFSAVQQIFRENDVSIDYQEIGGYENRIIKLAIRDGKVWLKTSGMGEKEI